MFDDQTPRLYLEDLRIGDVFTSAEYVVDEASIIEFARQFDPQPFHTDPEAAKPTFFGGLAASGWHTAAITMRLLVTSGLPLADGIVGASAELSWLRPTRPGDTLRAEATIREIRPSRSKPDRALVTFNLDTTNQDNEVVQRFTGKLSRKNRPPAD
ncbi:MAG: MaoC family dehydratase [Actinomycetota bacterium]|nr:MaoC family dehydratase [Actinomycetota bacterium]